MKKILSLGLFVGAALPLLASPARITIQADRPGHPVSPHLWGIFFEDINLSTDGGLYPELIRNRSFEDKEQPENWSLVNVSGHSEMRTDASRPLNPTNPRSLCLRLDGTAKLVNQGYWGMNIVKGETYLFTLAARSDDFKNPLAVKLVGPSGQVLAAGNLSGITTDWNYHTLNLIAGDSAPQARLEIEATGPGTLFLDMVSLLPRQTWKNHGLRADLAESMSALQPSFLRFPGGCWVEGEFRSRMYNWKKTIGDVATRVPLWNIWDYYATHGLGFHEYLQMAEDLGAEPLFCINVGMSHRETIPLAEMGPWVQDALDAIEYANGPTNSHWGGLRAKAGHPAPFHLRYLEIGNENGGAAYRERWPMFVNALKARYPEVRLIANQWEGGYPKAPLPEIVDEHYYDTPDWFLQQADRYDAYDRNGPKIFVGEYAVTRKTGQGNLRGAIGEAAFMIGMERNSDVVVMASYAPLFCNANHKRWPVNLINFDSSRWFGIPSFYVQKMFSENRGTVTLPTVVETSAKPEALPAGGIGVGTWNTAAEFKDLKVTAPDGRVLFTSDFSKNADSWKKLGGGAWSVENGALKQTAEREFVRALAGDSSWTDYTLELKARKLAGREGFLILFHIQDDEDAIWWNLGGWQNTKHGVEMGAPLDRKDGGIEVGRWYDIRIDLRGKNVKCYLDGRLIHDLQDPRKSAKELFASTTRDAASGDIIVKIVNSSATPTDTEIVLNGVAQLDGKAKLLVLSSTSPKDENTLDEPTKVATKTEWLPLVGPRLTRAFPGNSVTVLRIPTTKPRSPQAGR